MLGQLVECITHLASAVDAGSLVEQMGETLASAPALACPRVLNLLSSSCAPRTVVCF
jgi:hypothetical protein